MIVLAKILEAVGIACVMIGLVQGVQGHDMWMELYLFLIGILVFLVGWRIEKRSMRKRGTTDKTAGTP